MIAQTNQLSSDACPIDVEECALPKDSMEHDRRHGNPDNICNDLGLSSSLVPANELKAELPVGEVELSKEVYIIPDDSLPVDVEASLPTLSLQPEPDSELSDSTSSPSGPIATSNISISLEVEITNPEISEREPTTQVKDDPLPAAPPPPSPPPKDVPPKDVPPKDVPPKDVPPKDVPPKDLPRKGPLQSKILSSSVTGPDLRKKPSKSHLSSDDENDDTRSEIHDLFEKSHRASVCEEHLQSTSSSTSLASSLSPNFHPPRSSSLLRESTGEPTSSLQPLSVHTHISPHIPENPVLIPIPSHKRVDSPLTSHRPPPPDEDLPFDFHRFLSQLRHRSADPVAKFLKSFLHEFAKKQWMVHEQVKIIRDFLTFIYAKMDFCEVWREVGDGEMDNAMEGMEKLVMNRLYTQTFSPAIHPAANDPRVRADERFPGRRGQHQEDVERDEILTQKIRIYSWIREDHLDIGDTVSGEGGRRFLDLAVKEMLKIGSYRAPRDKVICVLNCCKVIFGLLRHSKSDESADKFVPLLIYVVLRANPEHLVSNVQYILRFRNPDKLTGEAGYYLSSLMGAIQFVENLDRSSLTITAEEFEANVEAAVAAIAERPPPLSPVLALPENENSKGSLERERGVGYNTDNSEDRAAAVTGLLRTIQRPLTTIGRIFSDDGPSSSDSALTPQIGNTPRHSPTIEKDDLLLTAVGGRRNHGSGSTKRRTDSNSNEAASRQASADVEEAAQIGRIEYENVVEILKGMFPGLDQDIIGDVVRMKEGRVGLAVDACLALSST